MGEGALCYHYDQIHPFTGDLEAEDLESEIEYHTWETEGRRWTGKHSCGFQFRWAPRDLLTEQFGFTIHAVIELSRSTSDSDKARGSSS